MVTPGDVQLDLVMMASVQEEDLPMVTMLNMSSFKMLLRQNGELEELQKLGGELLPTMVVGTHTDCVRDLHQV